MKAPDDSVTVPSEVAGADALGRRPEGQLPAREVVDDDGELALVEMRDPQAAVAPFAEEQQGGFTDAELRIPRDADVERAEPAAGQAHRDRPLRDVAGEDLVDRDGDVRDDLPRGGEP